MLSRINLRTKLLLLIALPLLGFVLVVGLRVNSQFERAGRADAQAEEVSRVLRLGELADSLTDEQQLSQNPALTVDDITGQRGTVDEQIAGFLRNPGTSSTELVALISQVQSDLVEVRGQLPADPAALLAGSRSGAMREALQELESYAEQVESHVFFQPDRMFDANSAADANTVLLFDRFSDALDKEGRAFIGLSMLPAELVDEETKRQIIQRSSQTQVRESALRLQMSDRYADAINEQLATPEMVLAFQIRDEAFDLEPGNALGRSGEEIAGLAGGIFGRIGELRSAMIADSTSDMQAFADAARNNAYRTLAAVFVLALLFMLLVAALYRSIRRPIQNLTKRSRAIAERDLPEVVASLRSDASAEVPEIALIEAESTDEIGELVHAFNQMSTTAVELAGRQAAARRSAGDMFMNLGRRNQKLLNRVLRHLSALERNEEDPEALEALYNVDHLVTRMRRNAESLLVLAGASQTRRWDQPAQVGDVARAALGEVENYERVDITGDTEFVIAADYIADIAHILAELIENALVFSPPTTRVTVVTRKTHRGFLIAVADQGVGLSESKTEMLNRRITEASTQEETPSKFLGLFVVGRLAAQRDIDVELLESPTGGVTARLMLPAEALHIDTPGAKQMSEPQIEAEDLATGGHDVMEASLAEDVAGEHTPSQQAEAVPFESASETAAAVEQDRDEENLVVAGLVAADRREPQAAPAEANKFGIVARRPGANLPATLSEPREVAAATAPSTESDPLEVRRSLAGFQSGTRRAEKHGSNS